MFWLSASLFRTVDLISICSENNAGILCSSEYYNCTYHIYTSHQSDFSAQDLEVSDVVKEGFAFYRPFFDDIRENLVAELVPEGHIKQMRVHRSVYPAELGISKSAHQIYKRRC